MDALLAIYDSLGLREAQTLIQSGNIIFRAEKKDLVGLPERIGKAIERSFGFRPDVIVRTASELRAAIAKNPFARRRGIDPSRLLVTFLASEPRPEARDKLLSIKSDPEELRIEGREVYVYYPNGMARPKLLPGLIEKTLNTSGTGRNWNTVGKLLEMAERLEGSR